jgi:TonB family protein
VQLNIDGTVRSTEKVENGQEAPPLFFLKHNLKMRAAKLNDSVALKALEADSINVEEMPQFPGGDKARLAYLMKTLRYPDYARQKNIVGRVTIKFVVEEDGVVTNAELMQGIGGGCDEEALRVIGQMPDWKPGTVQGIPVQVYYILPIRFSLEEAQQPDYGY